MEEKTEEFITVFIEGREIKLELESKQKKGSSFLVFKTKRKKENGFVILEGNLKFGKGKDLLEEGKFLAEGFAKLSVWKTIEENTLSKKSTKLSPPSSSPSSSPSPLLSYEGHFKEGKFEGEGVLFKCKPSFPHSPFSLSIGFFSNGHFS